jgi:excisionase family DNA binding protein
VSRSAPIDLATRVALSVAEAAAALGVSEAHLRNHLHEVPHFHLGGRVLFPVAGLHEWAKRQVEHAEARAKRDAAEILRAIS